MRKITLLFSAAMVVMLPYAVCADTPTFTPTATSTACTGEGSAAISPFIVNAGSSGNTFAITYTAGATGWGSGASAGTFKFTIPPGWPAPDTVTASASGFMIISTNSGTISRITIIGQDVYIKVSDLAALTGQIFVSYGDKSLGGPGVDISFAGCPMPEMAFFDALSSPDSSLLCPISPEPMVGINCIFSNTATFTPTATSTACQGEGAVYMNNPPIFPACCSTGNTYKFGYIAGPTTWAGAPVHGTLKVRVPDGWSPPSLDPLDPGYFTVSVEYGILYSISINGMYMIIQVRALTYGYGMIHVFYGDMTGGGPGATAPCAEGDYLFEAESAPSGDDTCRLADNLHVFVSCATSTPTNTATDQVSFTITPTFSFTNNPTPTATQTMCGFEGSISLNPSLFDAGSTGNTMVYTYTAGPTAWVAAPGYGFLMIDAPFDAPSLNPADPGYFTVSVINGTLQGTSVNFNRIVVNVSGLQANTGQIIVSYGDKSGGGPGTTATTCMFPASSICFGWYSAFTAPDYTSPCFIGKGIQVCINCGTPTITPTNTASPTPEAVPPPCLITSWGIWGSGDGQISKPVGAAVDSSGNVFITEYGNDRVQKFDSSGVFITKWGGMGNGNSQFNEPDGIAVDSGGNVYVVDHQNYRVQKFSNTGAYITQWGSYGTGNGQFAFPAGIAVDSAGNVYVADMFNHRIQKFSSAGVYITQWGSLGSGTGNFDQPMGVAVDSGGNVYVTDSGNNRIQEFSNTGAYIAQWGSPGNGAGQLNGPYGISIDGSGNVYVADSNNNRIQKFTGTGAYITQWGSYGSGDGQFGGDCGVANDGDGNVYVTDWGNNRVEKFGPCGSPTPTYSATATAPPVYTNTPTSSASGTPTCTPTRTVTIAVSYTDSPTSTPTMTATPTQQAASTLLSIKKSVSGQQPAVGAIITYEIEIRNMDTKPAYNIMLWDTLPAQVEFVYNNSGVPYTKTGQYILWDLSLQPALNPTDVLYIDFECKITALADGVLIANFAGCDYSDASGKHAPIFSEQAFYPLGVPAVYPNPGTDHVRFKNIVPGSEIGIYTLSGELVNTLAVPDTKITWDCKNSYGRRVSPGIYYYVIKDSKGKALYAGKLFIMRP